MLIRGRHYATGQPLEIATDAGIITTVTPLAAATELAEWLAPALFDLQINGCHGISFNAADLTVAGVRHVVDECAQHGLGGLCPTLVTNSFEALHHGFTTLRRACVTDAVVAAAVPGFHLEGPYIASEDGPRGAHPLAHARPPQWDEFSRWQDAAEGMIRLLTLAPELPGALPFIEQVTRTGVVVAIGHTAAKPSHIRDAIHAGATLSTHLGNGSHALLPRHENYIWEQLAADELWASFIPDGHHLPPALVKSIVRVKTPQRAIITCDASSLAGLPVGRYTQWGGTFDVLPHGKVVVPDTPFLAGSGVFTDACVNHTVRVAGVCVADAIDMASIRPRELLRFPIPTLSVGQPARLLVYHSTPEQPFSVVRTILEGHE